MSEAWKRNGSLKGGSGSGNARSKMEAKAIKNLALPRLWLAADSSGERQLAVAFSTVSLR